MLDITGCAHLFGGEAALAADLAARLSAQGFHARAAIADTPGRRLRRRPFRRGAIDAVVPPGGARRDAGAAAARRAPPRSTRRSPPSTASA